MIGFAVVSLSGESRLHGNSYHRHDRDIAVPAKHGWPMQMMVLDFSFQAHLEVFMGDFVLVFQ